MLMWLYSGHSGCIDFWMHELHIVVISLKKRIKESTTKKNIRDIFWKYPYYLAQIHVMLPCFECTSYTCGVYTECIMSILLVPCRPPVVLDPVIANPMGRQSNTLLISSTKTLRFPWTMTMLSLHDLLQCVVCACPM